MEDLLLEMMNKGFIVYIDGSQFTLQKVNTPASPVLHHFDNNKTYKHFASLEEALAEAKNIMGWKSDQEKQAEVKKTHGVLWELEIMYKHRGEKIPRIMSMGQSANITKEEALESAKKSGQLWVDYKFKQNEIESWEVRVRPAKRN